MEFFLFVLTQTSRFHVLRGRNRRGGREKLERFLLLRLPRGDIVACVYDSSGRLQVGEHQLTVWIAGRKVEGCPLSVAAYSAERVRIEPLGGGAPGQPVQFVGECGGEDAPGGVQKSRPSSPCTTSPNSTSFLQWTPWRRARVNSRSPSTRAACRTMSRCRVPAAVWSLSFLSMPAPMSSMSLSTANRCTVSGPHFFFFLPPSQLLLCHL